MRRTVGAIVAAGALALATPATPASAGWVIDQVTREGGGGKEAHPQRLYLQANRLKMVMLEGAQPVQATVMDLDAQTITHIDYQRRAFTTATAKEYADMMRQGFAKMGEAMGQMQSQMKELEEQLKNLPPEQRKQIEAMMKQAQGAQRQQPTLKAEDCAPDKVDVKRTGKSATVAGFAATGYQLFENGKLDAEVWIAPAITAAREIDPQKLERLMKEMLKALPQCPPRGQMVGADPVWKLMKDGYPVRSVDADGGAVTEVVKAESRALAATEFQAPAGFARKPLSELMGGQ